MGSEGQDEAPEQRPYLTEEQIQELWNEWTGDLSPLRDIYVAALETMKVQDPDEDRIRRANKAVAKALIYKILFVNHAAEESS